MSSITGDFKGHMVKWYYFILFLNICFQNNNIVSTFGNILQDSQLSDPRVGAENDFI